MATKRTVDLITEAFSDVMTNRRKYILKNPDGSLLKELYFPPLTRFDRIQAQAATGSDDALAISTRLLCQLAQNEDGTKAFASADAENLKRFVPETVLNDLEIFMMDIQVDINTAKNE
jgi:hypothetical protein|tara:strand:+ start:234 stop:587 length:354 start_codon:yes stop_codon:yes gene_type:complete